MTTPNEISSQYLLRIVRGATNFPDRPLGQDRFLIGGGSNCQLQLGGGIPILHSIIIQRGGHLWIDAVVPEPQLLVNGQVTRESQLTWGDTFEIGPFQFEVDKRHVELQVAEEPVEVPDDLSELTAAALVDLLEDEIGRQEEVELHREAGAAALLAAAAAAHAEEQRQTTSAEDLNRAIEELKRRSTDLAQLQAELAKRARQLEDCQVRLQAQLHELVTLDQGTDGELKRSA